MTKKFNVAGAARRTWRKKMDAEDFILGLRFLLAKVKRQQKDWDEYNIKEVAILNDGILVAQFFDKKNG